MAVAASGRGRILTGGIALAVLAFAVSLFALTAAARAAEPTAQSVTVETNDVTPVEITFNAFDADGDELTYSVGDGPNGGTLGEIDHANGTVAYTADPDFAGVDTFTYSASDGTGSADANVTVIVRPDTTIDLGPDGLTNQDQPSWSFSSPQAGVEYQCRVDGGAWSACADPFTADTLSDGPHSFQVRAGAGSIRDNSPASRSITVDATDPSVVVAQAPGQADPTNDSPIYFQLTSDESLVPASIHPSDFDVANGTLNSIAGNNAEGTAFTLVVEPVGQGPVTIEPSSSFAVSDLAGNEPDVYEFGDNSVTYDTLIAVTIDSAPSDGNLDARPTIEFSSDEDPDIAYECRLFASDTPEEERPEAAECDSPFQAPFLDRSTEYTFDVTGTDAAGNTDSRSTSWTQANTAPTVSEPTETVEAGETVTLSLGGSDADSDPLAYTVTGEVTGGALGEIDQENGTVTFTAATDAVGQYTFAYEVSDAREGGVASGVATVVVQPQTSFVEVPPAETNDTTPTWTFESPSGVTTFECRLDAADPQVDPWVNCDGGSFTAPGELGEGEHTLEVRATSGELADPTPATGTTVVDVTAPDVSITDRPVALSNAGNPTFSFESTDGTASFECAVDGGDFVPCTTGEPIGELEDGEHTFHVRAVDPAGNPGTEQTYTWEVDTTLPVIELGGQPEGERNGPGAGKSTNAKRPIWYFQRSDLNLDEASIRCRVDEGAWLSTCLSPYQPSSNLNDGQHTFYVEATDLAGNVATLEVPFTVNTVRPSAIITEQPPSPSAPDVTFEFASSVSLGDDGGFACRVGSGANPTGPWAPCASPVNLSVGNGTNTFQVKAIDSAGNESTGAGIASYTWNTIAGSPDTVINVQNAFGKNAAFGFSSPGQPLASFECSLDDGAWEACSSPKSYTNLSEGPHSFQVRAVNQVGTQDASPATRSWTVVAGAAPETTITRQPPAGTVADSATFSFVSDDVIATYECKLDGGAWEACQSPKAYSGLSVGSHTFLVRATSSEGIVDASPASVSWAVTAKVVDPPVQPCALVAPSAIKSGMVRIAKGLRVGIALSHGTARSGDTVEVDLLANGSLPTPKARRALKKSLKQVRVLNGGARLATLTRSGWSGSFTAVSGPAEAQTITVKFVRKKGKAMRRSVSLNVLPACPGN